MQIRRRGLAERPATVSSFTELSINQESQTREQALGHAAVIRTNGRGRAGWALSLESQALGSTSPRNGSGAEPGGHFNQQPPHPNDHDDKSRRRTIIKSMSTAMERSEGGIRVTTTTGAGPLAKGGDIRVTTRVIVKNPTTEKTRPCFSNTSKKVANLCDHCRRRRITATIIHRQSTSRATATVTGRDTWFPEWSCVLIVE